MPDNTKSDELLSPEEYKQLQDIAQTLPQDHPAAGRVRDLLNSQRTPFERTRTGEGISLKGAGSAAVETLKSMLPPDPTGGHSIFSKEAWVGDEPIRVSPSESGIAEAGREAAAGWERSHHPLGKIGESISSGLASLLGVSGRREAEHAARGEGGAIIGETAVPAAAAGLSYIGPKVLPRISSEVASRVSSLAEKASAARPTLTRLVLGHRIATLADLLSKVGEQPGTPSPISEPKPIAPQKGPSLITMPESYPVPRERISMPTETAPKVEPRLTSIEAPTAPAAIGKITPKTLKGYFNPGRVQPLKLNELIDQAAGVKPLRPDVPLGEQLTSAPAPALEEIDPIKAKYPDPAVRQMVRANGEAIVQAVGKNPNLMKQLHDLTRVELRQALVNAGEDMGQVTVSSSKFAGEGSIPREEAFNRLLKKGVKPEQIVDLAKKTSEPGFKGGINIRGAEESMKPIATQDMIRSLSAEIDTMKQKLRNAGARPQAEKDALQKQISDYEQRLAELRKKTS